MAFPFIFPSVNSTPPSMRMCGVVGWYLGRVIICVLCVVGCLLWVFCCGFSVVGCRLSVVGCGPSAVFDSLQLCLGITAQEPLFCLSVLFLLLSELKKTLKNLCRDCY